MDMDVVHGLICLLLLSVCRVYGQIPSASANVDIAVPISNNSSVTEWASGSFNPVSLPTTLVSQHPQTSGGLSEILVPSAATVQDYATPQTASVTSTPARLSNVQTSRSSFRSAEFMLPQMTMSNSESILSRDHASASSAYSTSKLQSVSIFSTSVSVLSVMSAVSVAVPVAMATERERSSLDMMSQEIQFTDSQTILVTSERLPVSSSVLVTVSIIAPSVSVPITVATSMNVPTTVATSMNVPIGMLPPSDTDFSTSGSVGFVPSAAGNIPRVSSEHVLAPSASFQLTSMVASLESMKFQTSDNSVATDQVIMDVSTPWGEFMDKGTETVIESSTSTVPVPSWVMPPSSSDIPVVYMDSSEVVEAPTFPQSSGEISSSLPTTNIVPTVTQIPAEIPETTEVSITTSSSQRTTTPAILETKSVLVSTTDELASSTSVFFPDISVKASQSEDQGYSLVAVSEGRSSTSEATATSTSIHMSASPTLPVLPTTPPSVVVPSPSAQTTSVLVLPSKTESVSSSTAIHPRISSTSEQPSSTVKASPGGSENLKDCYFKLVFDVDCLLILNNSLILAEFVGSLEEVLVINLHIEEKQIKLYDPLCGSIIIHVALHQVPYPMVKYMLYSQFRQRKFEVPIMINNQWLKLFGSHAVEIDAPDTPITSLDLPGSGLDKVDLIVIIVACCICGMLITIGVILCAKECYRRKYAQSFDLLEVPHVNLKLEDFTLTRIPRPKTTYSDESVTMHGYVDNSSQRIVKNSGHHVTGGHHVTNGNGVHATDLQLRMKQNKDGLVVGVTGYAMQTNGSIGDKSAKRNSSSVRTKNSRPCDPATENLLDKGDANTPMGAHNPIFVDDESLSHANDDHGNKKD